MELFRVPSREIEARVLMEGGAELDGRFYVPASGSDGSPGRLIDRLNDEAETFLPLAEARGSYLLNKSRIVIVQPAPGSEEVEGGADESAVNHEVQVQLVGGMVLDGRLQYWMPPERRRVLDFFNSAPRFIPLLGDERVILINCSFVIRLRGVDEA